MLRPHPPLHASEIRAVAEAMIRANEWSTVEIAARSGVPLSTVYRWKRRIARRRGPIGRPDPLRPEAWTARRRAAVARLLAKPEVDPRDVAQALGGPRLGALGLKRALGLAGRRGRAAEASSLGDLNAALRTQVGRQIKALDARLKAEDATIDPGKALRDLAGLKRLLDELTETTRRTREGDADEEPDEDLAVLRDRIARRYAAFAPDWAESRLGAQPAAETPESARP